LVGCFRGSGGSIPGKKIGGPLLRKFGLFISGGGDFGGHSQNPEKIFWVIFMKIRYLAHFISLFSHKDPWLTNATERQQDKINQLVNSGKQDL
jgi:hypothetical protein